jgi:hypothetical protein
VITDVFIALTVLLGGWFTGQKSPSLYRAIWCGTSACHAGFLSITDDQHISRASGFTGQVTLGGYDNMTGLGTPRGQHFITALRAGEAR